MKILKARYAGDGPAYKKGDEANVVQIESDEDYTRLIHNIESSNFYGSAYFDSHIGRVKGIVRTHNLLFASIISSLKPRKALEIGCGAADDLFTLGLSGEVDVHGVDISEEILKDTWPELAGKLAAGDLLDVLRNYRADGRLFDTVLGFDIWEHLDPRRLGEYITSLIDVSTQDAFYFFVIPGFGCDRMYGEIFPLEFEENREQFDKREPFKCLTLNSFDPLVPSSGHLTWAHTEWWEKLFADHGLARVTEVEKKIHNYFGECLFYARRTFYVFRRNTQSAEERERRLTSEDRLTVYRAIRGTARLRALVKKRELDTGTHTLDNTGYDDFIKNITGKLEYSIAERIIYILYTAVDKTREGFFKLAIGLDGLAKFVIRKTAPLLSRLIAKLVMLGMKG
ncbi:MAG: class I SAM-dependent methyltransferase [Nitrospinae bacterium]|nr:class I SAM-dependent methyltransferase [Nitrospinota bacterium]